MPFSNSTSLRRTYSRRNWGSWWWRDISKVTGEVGGDLGAGTRSCETQSTNFRHWEIVPNESLVPELSLPVITQKFPLSSPLSSCQLTGSTDGWAFPSHISECYVLPWHRFTLGTSLGIAGMSHHFPLDVQAAAFFSSDINWMILTHIHTR